MRRLILSILLLAFVLSTGATAQTTFDLGDLVIDSSRVPMWYPAAVAEANYEAAKSWPEFDVTCFCEDAGCGTPEDYNGDPCTAAGDSSPFPYTSDACLTTPGPANPADPGAPTTWLASFEDWAQIECVMLNVPDNSVAFIPDGTYDMGDASFNMIQVDRDNVVIRGESNTGTILRATHRGFPGTCRDAQADGGACNDESDCVGNEICSTNAKRGWADCSNTDDCSSIIISIGKDSKGLTKLNWDGGYEENATSITLDAVTTLSVGGWIELTMDGCAALITQPTGPTDDSLTHISKIVSISGSGPFTVVIDRGLRMDYDDDGCQTFAFAYSYDPRINVGIENLKLTSLPCTDANCLVGIPPHGFGNSRGFIAMGGVTGSWVIGNDLDRAGDEIARIRNTVRTWWQGNTFQNFCYTNNGEGFNTEGVTQGRGAVDNVIENNHFLDYCVGTKYNGGPEGNVWSYNYMLGGTPHPGETPEKSMFIHGMYARENLMEGNDVDSRIMYADHWWGTNGPRITVFRNRVRVKGHSGDLSAIVANRDKSGSWDSVSFPNIIGNTATHYFNDPESGSFPFNLGGDHDIDGSGSDSSGLVVSAWFEKNMWRDARDCADSGQCAGGADVGKACEVNGDCTGSTCTLATDMCGWHHDTPNADTSCGGVAGDCRSGVTGNPASPRGTNYPGDSASTDHLTDTSIPASLYRTEAPSWWCEEACDWSGITGIGAWGDDFCTDIFDTGSPNQTSCAGGDPCPDGLCDTGRTQGLCSLPAQIMAEGGTCTALAEASSTKSLEGGSISGGSLTLLEQTEMMLQVLGMPNAY